MTGNKKATIDVDTNASFLLFDKRDEVIRYTNAGTRQGDHGGDGRRSSRSMVVIEADPEGDRW